MNLKGVLIGVAVFCLFSVFTTAFATEKSCEELIAEAEQLYTAHQFDESDDRLDQVIKTCPELAEPYWRKGRNIFARLERIPRDQKPEKKELTKLYSQIESLTNTCIERDENDGHCYFWKGVGIGRRATTRGVLRSLFSAKDVESSWLEAQSLGLTYNKCESYNALGMFYRVVPEWLCHFPLKQIVGTCGDKRKSVEYQRKAVACNPDINNNKELGVSLLCHGQEYDQPEEVDEARKILKNIQSMPAVALTDKIDKEHARTLLADPSIACGYQRDAQQEVNKEAYDNDQK